MYIISSLYVQVDELDGILKSQSIPKSQASVQYTQDRKAG